MRKLTHTGEILLAFRCALYGAQHSNVIATLLNESRPFGASSEMISASELMKHGSSVYEHFVPMGHEWTFGKNQAQEEHAE